MTQLPRKFWIFKLEQNFITRAKISSDVSDQKIPNLEFSYSI